MLDGKIVAVWAGNLNTGSGAVQDNNGLLEGVTPEAGQLNLEIFAATAQIAAGPRVVSSTMGPVHAVTAVNGMAFNNTFTASDGTPQVAGLHRHLRPPGRPGDLRRQPGHGDVPRRHYTRLRTPVDIPVSSKPTRAWTTALSGRRPSSSSSTTPQSGVGAYSYSIASTIGANGVRDRIRQATAAGVQTSAGNLMDQNANGTQGEVSDNYSDPRPISGNLGQVPYDPLTLPLIVPWAVDHQDDRAGPDGHRRPVRQRRAGPGAQPDGQLDRRDLRPRHAAQHHLRRRCS